MTQKVSERLTEDEDHVVGSAELSLPRDFRLPSLLRRSRLLSDLELIL